MDRGGLQATDNGVSRESSITEKLNSLTKLMAERKEELKSLSMMVKIPQISFYFLVVFQLLSSIRLFATQTAACHTSCPSPSLGDAQTNIHWAVMPSNQLVLCCPLLLLPSPFPNIRVFSNKLAPCIRWPKYWSFSFSISPSNEHPGMISFRMD